MSGSSSVHQDGANCGEVSSNTSTKGDNSTVRGGVKKNDGRTRGGVKSIRLVNKSDVTDTYHVFYDKKKIITTVTVAASEVHQWIEDVYNEYQTKLDKLVVGLDIEWKRIRIGNNSTPNNKVAVSQPINKAAVLQLCVGRRCLIFQLLWCDGIPQSLHDFLGNKKFTFVGAGIKGDAYKLLVDHNLLVASAESGELGPLAAYKLTNTVRDYKGSRFPRDGLKYLARDILNLHLPKKRYIQLSNWGKTYLSHEQVEYACLDAYVSFKLGRDLTNLEDPVHTYPGEEEEEEEEER